MKIRKLISDLYRYFYPLSLEEIYKRMGVKIGDNCKIQFGVVIDYSHYWHIQIGDNVTLAPNVHILAHDASTYNKFGYAKIGKVSIQNNVFVGAGSIILPGVIIGENSIIGAGSIVKKDVPPNTVFAGNPAKFICTIEDYYFKIESDIKKYPIFSEDYTLRGNISTEKKKEMNHKMKHRYGFVK